MKRWQRDEAGHLVDTMADPVTVTRPDYNPFSEGRPRMSNNKEGTMSDEKMITDTVDETASYGVSATRVPTPPVEWGPGHLVRDERARCWRHVPLPPPVTVIGDPANVMKSAVILECWWYGKGQPTAAPASMRVRGESDRGVPTVVAIRIAECPVSLWEHPCSKPSPGELALNAAQARVLRDALTAFVEASSRAAPAPAEARPAERGAGSTDAGQGQAP